MTQGSGADKDRKYEGKKKTDLMFYNVAYFKKQDASIYSEELELV